MDQAIVAFDLKRMLIGDEPPLFLLEIVVRTIIIYGYTLLLLRWLGSRTVGQLSTVEFLLVIALGSAVGDAMFYPAVSLLHAMLVVTVVVVVNKVLDMVIAKSGRAERLLDGKPREVVRDGVVARRFLDEKWMSLYELFQELREDGIEQLGEVRRAYIEKDGKVTVFRHKGDTPRGLAIVPPSQVEPRILVSPGDPAALEARMADQIARRDASQPTRDRSAGSTFRNPAGFSSTGRADDSHELKAWKVIDDAGLRGATLGGAQMSPKHSNFLINIGGATAADLENLGEDVRKRVFQQSGITLEWEIMRVGEYSHK